ncbi:MAG: peptidoglycan-binding protein [Acidobacteriota bacterium]|nr:peptidoglycan-binding protein [Acidobacteriota bacterium]
MKRLLCVVLTLLFAMSSGAAAAMQNTNNDMTGKKPAAKRGPVFRATKDQIKQVQGMLKERGLYTGEQTGKLDPTTRAAIKKYQEAEGVKVTGTLNKDTLVKMNVELTDRQKAM